MHAVLVGKSEIKRPLGDCTRRGEHNIEMDLTGKIEERGMDLSG
jgi:hypothetical protein